MEVWLRAVSDDAGAPSTPSSPVSFGFDFAGFKTLALVLAEPPAPFLVLGAWGAWRLVKARRTGVAALVLSAAGIWLGCTEATGEWLTRHLLEPPGVLSLEDMAAMQRQGGEHAAIVVLGGGARQSVPELHAGGLQTLTAERLHYGVWLSRRTGWPIAFSGGIGWTATRLLQSEAALASHEAAEIYALPLRWAEGASRDTRENAAQVLPLLAAAGVKQVVLVTHDAHMRRALRAFVGTATTLGITVQPAPIGGTNIRYTSVMDWCPTVEGYGRVRYAVYEWLAWHVGR